MPVCFVLRQQKITFALWNRKAATVKFAPGCPAQQPPAIPECQSSAGLLRGSRWLYVRKQNHLGGSSARRMWRFDAETLQRCRRNLFPYC